MDLHLDRVYMLAGHMTGLPWGLNFNPHTHPIPIPMGIPIPTAALGLPLGLNFNPHTHPIPIPMGIPIPTAALPYELTLLVSTVLVHFDMIPERDRQTDGRTDRQTPHDGNSRACA